MSVMTPDDEAFIRAIVAAPGDDLPRLVYADWLDELRGDPWGAYLRAEAAWAMPWKDGTRPADDPRLGAMAVGLDPVWVARVSRPPVGVCCEHVGFEKRRSPTTAEALANIEHRFNLTLPDDYKAFLLNYNAVWSDTAYSPAGFPCPDLIYLFAVNNIDGLPHDGPDVDFATAWQLKQLDLPWRLLQIEQGQSWPSMASHSRRNFIPILCSGEEPDGESEWKVIRVRGYQIGQVAVLGDGLDEFGYPPHPIASSFAEYLSTLVHADVAKPEYPIRRRLFEL